MTEWMKWYSGVKSITLIIFSRYYKWGGDPGADPKPAGEIILYISSGLETAWDLPGRAGKRCWGEGRLDYPARPAAITTGAWIIGRRWMDGQHCASALVRFRHKKRLLRVRKWTGFGVKYLFLSTQTRLLNALMKNIQWFVTFKSCNTVLNCGHWLGSLPPSSASPPHMKGYKQVMWTWYDVFCITVNMMLYVTYDTYRCEQISGLSRGLLLLLLLF